MCSTCTTARACVTPDFFQLRPAFAAARQVGRAHGVPRREGGSREPDYLEFAGLSCGAAGNLLYGLGRVMLVAGYFRVGRLAGVDLRLHWSLPVAALVFGSLRFEPILWLAFLGVILVHDVGHALLVRAVGCRVTGVDLTGFGGQCRYRGKADMLEHAIIAWGGVLAQSLLLVATLLVGAIFGHATGHAGALVEHTLVEVNLWIVAINLLPFPPLDGARAWRLFPELGARGWTLPRLVLYPLWRWAAQRRRQRVERAGPSAIEPSALEPNPSVARPTPQRRPSPVPAGSEPADADRGGADDELAEKPSLQAQRELAALLERIGDEAGRAKKRR